MEELKVPVIANSVKPAYPGNLLFSHDEHKEIRKGPAVIQAVTYIATPINQLSRRDIWLIA